eukprot:293568-Chlamydomonas_euryale.AAC.1
MDPDKVQAVEEWPRPANQTDVLQFLGLTEYYRRFIHKFSDIAAPMSDLVCVWYYNSGRLSLR